MSVRSLWSATSEEPAPPALPLRGSAKADVAIVGAGFTGLSAAMNAPIPEAPRFGLFRM